MRILYLLGVLLLLFLMPLPGKSGGKEGLRGPVSAHPGLSILPHSLGGGRCAMLGCLSKEEQIGRCSLRGRKCCRKKK
uniref:beta-defensin 103A-like n=1 Tax=Ictidomys tridecemlineatus TaxID=43179 RepID=UPI001A9E9FD1|nr:beta-defensin 103A-like [Ictidomys tridecemlineatus]